MKKNHANDNKRSIWGIKPVYRAKRIKPLLAMIEYYHNKNGVVNIIDIGGTKSYWDILPLSFLVENRVKIICVNLPGSTKETVDDDVFKHLEGDGCDLFQFSDKQFDIAHSNSVVEHVGDWDNMVRFASEVKRVASSFFVQTPNYWFPVEPHRYLFFAHWLPKPLEIWLLMHLKPVCRHVNGGKPQENIDKAMRSVDAARLLNKRMFRYLFPEGYIITERICFFAKSFVVVKE